MYASLAPGATHAAGGAGAARRDRQDQERRGDGRGGRAGQAAILAAEAYKRDGTSAVAREINEWIAVGDWTLYVTLSAEGRAGDGGRRAAGGQAVPRRGAEHDRLVRSHARRPGRKDRDATSDVLRGWALGGVSRRELRACRANMAENGHRSQTAGIDLITYQTGVKQVVVISARCRPAMPWRASDNIAIPTLTGMMLDRGTKTLDKFADRGAARQRRCAKSPSRVGTQSLEIRAKCLKKDLPLVLGLDRSGAAALPRSRPREFAKAKQQFIGSLQESMQQHRGARQRGVFPCDISRRPSEPSALDRGVSRARRSRPTLEQVQGVPCQVLRPGAHDAGARRRCAGRA